MKLIFIEQKSKPSNSMTIKAIFLLLAITFPLFCYTQVINEISYYNMEKGLEGGLAVKGQYMFLSNGEIVDNSDPVNPTLAGEYKYDELATSLIIDGNYAFYGTGMGRQIFIADISDVTNPVHQSTLNFENGNGVFGLAIKDNALFAALGYGGSVCSIDITDKSNPKILNILNIPDGQARDIVIKNDLAFVAHQKGLRILNIEDPSKMELVASTGTDYYNSIDINESMVFCGKMAGGVDVYSISDPLNPVMTFNIPNNHGNVWDLKYSDQHLYVATNNTGLFLYRINNNSGVLKANYPNEGNGQSLGVCVQDSLILLAGLRKGVAILQYDSTGTVLNPPDTTTVDIIKPANLSDDISIYPVPSNNSIRIDANNSIIERIKVINVNGKMLYNEKYNHPDKNFDLSAFPTGLLFIELETNQGRITKKIIKSE